MVPEGEVLKLNVNTNWPGASPESVQSLATSPIETLAVTVPDVHKVISQSRRGASLVEIEFLEDADLDLARFELADRLSLLRDDLPPNVQAPGISTILPAQFQELAGGDFFHFTLRAPRPINELRVIAKEDVRDALIGVEGVADVEAYGGQDPHLRVTLDPDKLELYGLTAWQIAATVRDIEGGWPVGQVDIGGTAFTMRIDHDLPDLEPLRKLPLQKYGGRLVLLEDVAGGQGLAVGDFWDDEHNETLPARRSESVPRSVENASPEPAPEFGPVIPLPEFLSLTYTLPYHLVEQVNEISTTTKRSPSEILAESLRAYLNTYRGQQNVGALWNPEIGRIFLINVLAPDKKVHAGGRR